MSGGFAAEIAPDGALVVRFPAITARITSLGRRRSCGCPRPPECPACLSVELTAEEEAALAAVLRAEQEARR